MNKVKLNFQDDPTAALAVLQSSRVVTSGEVVKGIVGVSTPYTLMRNNMMVDFVNVQIREVTVLDGELLTEILKAYNCTLETLPEELAPALLTLCQVQSFRERLDAIELRSGMTANFTVGSRNRSIHTLSKTEQSKFGVACEILGIDGEKFETASFAGVEAVAVVANRSIYSNARTQRLAITPKIVAPTNSNPLKITMSQDDFDNLGVAEIKAKLTAAGVSGFAANANKKVLESFVVIA